MEVEFCGPPYENRDRPVFNQSKRTSLEESSLDNEILVVQENNHLPGVVQECKNLIKSLNNPNLFDKVVISSYSRLMWKNKVNTAIQEYEEAKLKSSF